MTRPIRILIADDHPVFRKGLRALLTSMPTTELVGEATNGEEAIRLAEELQPDVILMDVVMPGMNGGETYDRLKQIDPEIKVLLSSGYSIDGQATHILSRGCNGFIQKPFGMMELSAATREVLDSHDD